MKRFYSCNSHLLCVIEELVEQYKRAPKLEVIHSPQSCYWCGKRAIYRLQLTKKKEGALHENSNPLHR